MSRFPQRVVLSGVACALLVAVGLLAWLLATGSSKAQSGTMHDCPPVAKWAIAVWDGESGTAADDALATCGSHAVSAAYSLDSQTGAWSRWFAGKPDVSNLPPLNDMQGVLALGSAAGPRGTATPTPSPTPTSPPTPTPTPAPAEPQLGTYTGLTSQGARIEFDVVGGSRGIARIEFDFEGQPPQDCSLNVEWRMDESPLPIVDGFFSLNEDWFWVSGTFDSPTTASGQLRGTYPGVEDMEPCFSATLTWSASHP